jgi:FlaA1/EpsC-like NDP-sugar epimerase
MHGKFSAVGRLGAQLRKGKQPGLALYGAGELAEQLFALGSLSADRVAVVFDSDARKHGRRFHEVDVRSPEDIVSINPAAIVILSSAEADIRRTIEATGYAGRVIAWSEVVPTD